MGCSRAPTTGLSIFSGGDPGYTEVINVITDVISNEIWVDCGVLIIVSSGDQSSMKISQTSLTYHQQTQSGRHTLTQSRMDQGFYVVYTKF